MMSTIRFITFGCKVNTYETQCMREAFLADGFTEAGNEADIYIINSCTVTSRADAKLFKCMRSLRREHPGSVIVLTGCYPQAHDDNPENIADIITGTSGRSGLPALVRKHIEDREALRRITPHEKGEHFGSETAAYSEGHTRAFVKIQDGCEMNCSYCIIPHARGHMRSKPPDILKKEIATLAEHSFREIVLVGINIMFYGREYGLDLADAVDIASEPQNIERVRISSIEPEKMQGGMIERLSANPKFCPSFHLSLQSGADNVLRAMKRHYDTDKYSEIVRQIRDNFPDAAITTDIMTGFPGETEDDHIRSMEFAKKIGFARIHVFPYSERNGTPAAAMEQVAPSVRHRRAREMTELGNELSRGFNNRFIGRTMQVLFEREHNGIHNGHTKNYLTVRLEEKYDHSLRGELLDVDIVSADSAGLTGTLRKLV